MCVPETQKPTSTVRLLEPATVFFNRALNAAYEMPRIVNAVRRGAGDVEDPDDSHRIVPATP